MARQANDTRIGSCSSASPSSVAVSMKKNSRICCQEPGIFMIQMHGRKKQTNKQQQQRCNHPNSQSPNSVAAEMTTPPPPIPVSPSPTRQKEDGAPSCWDLRRARGRWATPRRSAGPRQAPGTFPAAAPTRPHPPALTVDTQQRVGVVGGGVRDDEVARAVWIVTEAR